MKTILRIIKESWKVLIIASILSSIGGIGLRTVQEKLMLFIPLLITIPALNDMMGDFGIIIVSRFTTSLSEGKIKRPLYKSHFVKHLFRDIMPIAIFMAIYITILSIVVSIFKGFQMDYSVFIKLLIITVLSTLVLVLLIFIVAIIGGYYVYHKNQDPDDILIPITTSIADLGSMLSYSLFIYLFF